LVCRPHALRAKSPFSSVNERRVNYSKNCEGENATQTYPFAGIWFGKEAVNTALLKALVALVPASVLFSGSIVLFLKGKTVGSFLQLFGAGCLVVVVLTHVCEALHLFPWMDWGFEDSVGHYLDFWSAVLGLTLFPAGYLLHALTTRRA
jgi:hypothetical protein